ncbi:MAG: hypothetical protein K2N49_00165 [Ruminococcus sp.]|nr:hypothetical protein [Ruminococcus sp.]MDE5763528.1 hypothetical protein [Ruminococcus sp.]MDE7225273.1 hypothetical protein [Ruminococcus sp.]
MFPMIQVIAAEVANSWNGVDSTMMSGVLSELKDLLPIVAPAAIGFIGFRKGWGFVKGTIKGA